MTAFNNDYPKVEYPTFRFLKDTGVIGKLIFGLGPVLARLGVDRGPPARFGLRQHEAKQ
jgi:hypothetical protein